METKELYREILNEHNLNPSHKKELADATASLDGVNPSCGDNITLNLKVDENGVITDGSFTGSGCAVSQASCDMMLDLVIGKTREEACHLYTY
ncbi:MAG: SUF system NifU family Fe-S cluster assembly protein, partial [Treponemataceae bacterium]|nr:SUF system NifU family Fe-S cluster assembly protein [Treponemataceae bacterium]